MNNRMIVKLEGLLVFVASLYAFIVNDFKLVWFIVFLLSPDISMLGYIKGNRIGAAIYNLFHTYLISGVLLLLGIIMNNDILLQMGLIWTAHIGLDRLMGYGLKYNTDFKDTHLNRL